MRLIKARVRGYRSVIDSGYFSIDEMKTILIGPNEAGKTVLLQALQKLNPPKGDPGFDPLRDYPRSKYYEDIECGKINPAVFTVVEGHFSLSEEEKDAVPEEYRELIYVVGRCLDNNSWHRLDNAPPQLLYKAIEKDIVRILTRVSQSGDSDGSKESEVLSAKMLKIRRDLGGIVEKLSPDSKVTSSIALAITNWIDANIEHIADGGREDKNIAKLKEALADPALYGNVLRRCDAMLPKFILFDDYVRVQPSIHLANLAARTDQKLLDDKQYDYGSNCLLKLIGFTAKELSQAGVAAPLNNNPEEVKKYKDTLDKRDYRLNAASVRLSKEISNVWNPNPEGGAVSKFKIKADGQYLKVVVEDEFGVEVEFDQRSKGYQWLVSFFIVFFSEASDGHKNAILLLDEPGLSLHGQKQAEFREVLNKLSRSNQTIFTTHSPYMVGQDELGLVRVVELKNRADGTIVHSIETATDSNALLPVKSLMQTAKSAKRKSSAPCGDAGAGAKKAPAAAKRAAGTARGKKPDTPPEE